MEQIYKCKNKNVAELELCNFNYVQKKFLSFCKLFRYTTNLNKNQEIIYNYTGVDYLKNIILHIKLPDITSYLDPVTSFTTIANNNYIQFNNICEVITKILRQLKTVIDKIDYEQCEIVDVIKNNTSNYTNILHHNLNSGSDIEYKINLKRKINIFKEITSILNKYKNNRCRISEELNIIIKYIKNILKKNHGNYWKLKIEEDKLNKYKDKFSWIENIGKHIIDKVEIIINSQIIEIIDSNWLNIYNTLSLNKNKKIADDKLHGNISQLSSFNLYDNIDLPSIIKIDGIDNTIYCNKFKEYDLFIPLNFWFTRYSNSYFSTNNINTFHLKIKLKKSSNLYYSNITDSNKLNNLNNYIDNAINTFNIIYEEIFLDTNITTNNLFKLNTNTNLYINKLEYKLIEKIDFNKSKLTIDHNLPINKIISQIFIIVLPEETILENTKLYNNYQGITNDNFIHDINDSNLYSIKNKDKLIDIIDSIELVLNTTSTIKYNSILLDLINKNKYVEQIKNGIYVINMSLFPLNFQNSGNLGYTKKNDTIKLTINLSKTFINNIKGTDSIYTDKNNKNKNIFKIYNYYLYSDSI